MKTKTVLLERNYFVEVTQIQLLFYPVAAFYCQYHPSIY